MDRMWCFVFYIFFLTGWIVLRGSEFFVIGGFKFGLSSNRKRCCRGGLNCVNFKGYF